VTHRGKEGGMRLEGIARTFGSLCHALYRQVGDKSSCDRVDL
jgi:hypothetical protein